MCLMYVVHRLRLFQPRLDSGLMFSLEPRETKLPSLG